ncbi:MAG: GMC oxidoreductase, partial [Candidatus Sumerlaeota bacterium]|nr:GMC oxidoreductase [Candidatus Sumerlaeota bacterium]
PTNAKASMDRTYIPAAIEHGARVYTSARAEVLVYDKGRIAGAYARVLGPDGKPTGGEVAVWAKATVLAAGVLASPVLLRKSNPPYLSDAVGKNLCFHNGIAVAGVFDQEVNPWVGATQGWDTDVYIPDGIHMEVLWVNSAILMSRTRGFGEPLRRAMGELRRTAYWCIAIRGTSRGTVKAGRDWEPRLRFDLNDTDVGLLKRGMDLLVDHFFAAGARCVRPGLAGFDSEIRTPAQVEALKRLTTVQARQIVPSGNHVFGTCAMGADRKRSVVDSHCEAYDLPDLYICDTGIFPTPSAVNPQLTVMAMASRLAETLRKRY